MSRELLANFQYWVLWIVKAFHLVMYLSTLLFYCLNTKQDTQKTGVKQTLPESHIYETTFSTSSVSSLYFVTIVRYLLRAAFVIDLFNIRSTELDAVGNLTEVTLASKVNVRISHGGLGESIYKNQFSKCSVVQIVLVRLFNFLKHYLALHIHSTEER